MAFRKIGVSDDYIRLGLLCLMVVILYQFIISPRGLNRTGYLFFQDSIARHSHAIFYQNNKNPDVTIVALDDNSIGKVNMKWPWTRSKFAEMLDKIASNKPKVIAFDVTFAGKSPYGEADDTVLANSLDKSKNVVLASYFTTVEDEWVLPYMRFQQQADAVGFVNKHKDRFSSMVRYAWLVRRHGQDLEYSFGTKSAALYKDIPISSLRIEGRNLVLGKEKIRLNLDGKIPIKYHAREYNFDTIPASDVFDGKIEPSLIKNRLVMVGMTAETMHDFFLTPLGPMPGVVLNANMAANLLEKGFLQAPHPIFLFVSLFILMAILTLVAFRYPFAVSFVVTTIFAGGFYLLSLLAYSKNFRLDAFGAFVLFYGALAISRIYISITTYAEKSKMLNSLVTDNESGRYNIYYLIQDLDRQIKIAKTKEEFPSLILLEIVIDKKKGVPIEAHARKEIIRGVASVMKDKIATANGHLMRTADLELGVVMSRCNEEGLRQVTDLIYAEVNGLEFFLSKREERIKVALAVGLCYGPKIKEASAQFLLSAAHMALKKAKTAKDAKIRAFDVQREKLTGMQDSPTHYPTDGGLVYLVLEDLKRKNNESVDEIKRLNRSMDVIKNSYLTAISSLVKALEEKDVYTAGHSERVAKYAVALCEELGLSDNYMQTIRKASLLHDIGKISIPDSVLHKKGSLTAEDKEVIRRHQVTSVKILEPATFLKDTLPMILHHHERYDGKGYPHGLSGERIPLGARIISICDAFDAMTSGRTYNKPKQTESAFSSLREESGKQFDPVMVEKLISTIKKFPTE